MADPVQMSPYIAHKALPPLSTSMVIVRHLAVNRPPRNRAEQSTTLGGTCVKHLL